MIYDLWSKIYHLSSFINHQSLIIYYQSLIIYHLSSIIIEWVGEIVKNNPQPWESFALPVKILTMNFTNLAMLYEINHFSRQMSQLTHLNYEIKFINFNNIRIQEPHPSWLGTNWIKHLCSSALFGSCCWLSLFVFKNKSFLLHIEGIILVGRYQVQCHYIMPLYKVT